MEKSKISDLSTGHEQLDIVLGNSENSDSNSESDNYVPPDAKKGKYDADYNAIMNCVKSMISVHQEVVRGCQISIVM